MKNTEVKSQKHQDALDRAEAWNKLSPIDQLTELDTRLGMGIGAKKQRAKIAKKLGN
jgi:hypothetical protein